MEWLDLATKAGLSGTSLLLAGVVYTLWKKLESKDTKYEAMVAAKDAKIEALHERLTQTLIAVSERSDED